MAPKKIILTGDRPTGPLHIGHYVGSLRQRVELQNKGDYDEMYVFIADNQALTDNIENPDKIRDNILEVALDYLSVGLDPNKISIFVQSQVPEMAELAFYLMDFVTVATLERNPTLKAEIKQKDMGESLPCGFFFYPISQAGDIAAFDATLVPAGEDQSPMIEQCREIVRRFNHLYGPTLIEPKIILPENTVCQRLPGTDGKAKMSKSLGNCIYLSDSEATLRKKVMSMFTDPNHLKVSDPGNTKDNPVFIYLSAFASDEDFVKFLPQYKNLDELKAHYERGGLGDVVVKKFLFAVLNNILTPIREKRKYYEERLDEVYEILKEGSIKARAKASATMARVKRALRVDYFDDPKFLEDTKSKIINKQR